MAKSNKKTRLGLSCLITMIVLLISILGAYYSIKNLKFGLDLQGGFEVLYEVNSIDGSKLTPEMVESTYKIIDKRINVLGVSEPEIAIENNNIRVTMAGVDNIDEARKTISTTAALTFRTVSGDLLMDSSVLNSGAAKTGYDAKKGYYIALSVKDYDKFYEQTKKVSEMEDNRIVIWLDYEDGTELTQLVVKTKNKKGEEITTLKEGYYSKITTVNEDGEEVVENKDAYVCGDLKNSNCLSVAAVSQGFASDVIIEGNFTKSDAEGLVELINSGSMPTKLKEISSKTVTASFGEDSLSKTFNAGLIGIIAIAILLIVVYRVSGLIASISILAYTFLTLLLFNLVGGRLTLQGIAALVIGIGMAVDSAIILYSRIKEELNKKSSLKTAYEKASKESFISILDANVTTLIAAIILFKFGESSVRGFATMLIISIIVTFIVMVYLNKYLINLFVQSSKFENHKSMFIGFKEKTKARKLDFVKPRFVIFAVVGLIIIGGLFFTYSEGLNLGIDFKGGSTIEINSKNNLALNDVKEDIKSLDYKIEKIEKIDDDRVYITISNILDNEETQKVENYFNEKYEATTSVGAVSNKVKKDITKNAIKALIYACIGMIIYISIRFKFSYAISAIVALVHDSLIVLIAFSIFRFEVNSMFIAAILSIVGYSINDTIVIFDRIRENKTKKFKDRINKEEDLKEIVNTSLSQTIVRCIITTITTLLPVISLIVVGSHEVLNFNIALLIGLLAGTFSSIFISSQIWMLMEKRNIGRDTTKHWYDDNKKGKKKEKEELMVKGVNC